RRDRPHRTGSGPVEDVADHGDADEHGGELEATELRSAQGAEAAQHVGEREDAREHRLGSVGGAEAFGPDDPGTGVGLEAERAAAPRRRVAHAGPSRRAATAAGHRAITVSPATVLSPTRARISTS